MNLLDDSVTVVHHEFIKGYAESNKVNTISNILVSLPFIEDNDMYELAVECLDLLANMTDDEYFNLFNCIIDEIREEHS